MKKYLFVLSGLLVTAPVFAHHADVVAGVASHEFIHLMFNVAYVLVAFVFGVAVVRWIVKK